MNQRLPTLANLVGQVTGIDGPTRSLGLRFGHITVKKIIVESECTCQLHTKLLQSITSTSPQLATADAHERMASRMAVLVYSAALVSLLALETVCAGVC